jgi:hypothetical protein
VAKGYALGPKAAQWVAETYLARQGTENAGAMPMFEDSPEPRLLFRNNSGFEVPPFGVVRVTGYVEANGRLMLTAVRPSSTVGWFLVNNGTPVADGKVGVAQRGQIVRVAYTGTDPTVGMSVGVSQFTAERFPNGKPLLQLVCLGIIDPTKKLMWARAEPYTSYLIEAPSGGIPGRVGTLLGGAVCTVLVCDSGTEQIAASSVQVKVFNWSRQAACTEGDRYGMASWIDGRWQITAEDCNDTGSTVAPGTGGGTLPPPTNPIDPKVPTLITTSTFSNVTFSGTGTPVFE